MAFDTSLNKDAIFGVWMWDGLRLQRGECYWSDEFFLLRYRCPSTKEVRIEDATLDVYKWTGRNDHVARCARGLYLGGGLSTRFDALGYFTRGRR